MYTIRSVLQDCSSANSRPGKSLDRKEKQTLFPDNTILISRESRNIGLIKKTLTPLQVSHYVNSTYNFATVGSSLADVSLKLVCQFLCLHPPKMKWRFFSLLYTCLVSPKDMAQVPLNYVNFVIMALTHVRIRCITLNSS